MQHVPMVEQYQWCTTFQSISLRDKKDWYLLLIIFFSILKMIVWISLCFSVSLPTLQCVQTKSPKRQFQSFVLIPFIELSIFYKTRSSF